LQQTNLHFYQKVFVGTKETNTVPILDKLIDTGEIIFNEKILISSDETLGELHDEMMIKGAELVLKTTKAIQEGNVKLTKQNVLLSSEIEIKPAPKIHKTDCKINWNNDCLKIYNLVRGLCPYPAAFSEFVSIDNKRIIFKIFKVSVEDKNHKLLSGTILTDNKSFLKIAVNDGFINIIELQLAGKNKMNILHPLFRPSSADPQTKNPRNRTTMPVVFCFRIDQI